ncbi:MAG: glucosaminidase domain-containing protein [Bacilli bacterium]|nr:glucosaminidase domain-containing protein [Bacilli bacterium]MBP3635476.1 glucosaminidase domain-containing protein [Bacilli bacterium]
MNIFRIINDKVITVFICSMLTVIAFSSFLSNVDKNVLKSMLSSINEVEEQKKLDLTVELGKDSNVTKRVIVYDGMTMSELAEKLNRSMKSTISGKGELLASYSLEKGVDPYIALSIMLLETGCNWTCSSLTSKCNNVGGMKGSPGCDGGSYKAFATLDDGIKGFIDNLANNYYAYGLTTPEAMNKKYAESTTWAMKVNNYISSIKAK